MPIIPKGEVPLTPQTSKPETVAAPINSRDPWAHRSQGMRCSTCMWFVRKVGQVENDYGQMPVRLLGRCRRHAPTMNGFPAVFDQDWCGDHKLDETKV